MRYPYEFIVVNGETMTSAFPKVVQLHISGVVKFYISVCRKFPTVSDSERIFIIA